MADQGTFEFTTARPQIEQLLQAKGYELVNDSSEPNLVQAWSERGGETTKLVVDSGGQLRLTLTRRIKPPQASSHQLADGRTFQATREVIESITINFQLTSADETNLSTLLTEFEKL